MNTTEFCRALADNCAEVADILAEHMKDNDELLPHVFLADVTRYVLGDGKGRAAIVKFLDESFSEYGPDVEELIAVSFVEYLVDPDELSIATKDLDTPRIVSEWNRQRTS
ncbi:MAG: hypothetical protein HS116_19600 [Planctomycetes bacterium]|nr:hypothetical protein [Planctomycetota bacterium]